MAVVAITGEGAPRGAATSGKSQGQQRCQQKLLLLRAAWKSLVYFHSKESSTDIPPALSIPQAFLYYLLPTSGKTASVFSKVTCDLDPIPTFLLFSSISPISPAPPKKNNKQMSYLEYKTNKNPLPLVLDPLKGLPSLSFLFH